jgi:hypothetical protein
LDDFSTRIPEVVVESKEEVSLNLVPIEATVVVYLIKRIFGDPPLLRDAVKHASPLDAGEGVVAESCLEQGDDAPRRRPAIEDGHQGGVPCHDRHFSEELRGKVLVVFAKVDEEVSFVGYIASLEPGEQGVGDCTRDEPSEPTGQRGVVVEVTLDDDPSVGSNAGRALEVQVIGSHARRVHGPVSFADELVCRPSRRGEEVHYSKWVTNGAFKFFNVKR